MDRVFLVLCMARSGHHAIIHWICSQYRGGIQHVPNPYHEWRQQNLRSTMGTKKYGEGLSAARLYSLEDFDLRDFKKYDFLNFRALKGASIIIINRDPFNWIASSVKVWGFWGIKRRIKMWKKLVKQCLGDYKWIEQPILDINYNMWFSDLEYRKKIAIDLGLAFDDKGLEYVPEPGKGSGWDKREFDGHAQQMKVLERWKNYQNDKRFLAICSDPELIGLSERYFNFNPFK